MKQRNFWRLFVVCAVLGFLRTAALQAGPYDPPPSYYNSATGTGATLKSQLHNIIDGHTIRSYSAAREILKVTDVDPNNSSRIILVYDRVSQTSSNHSAWNREHTWPRGRGIDDSGPDNSDLHQLRPSTVSVNSARGSYNFGGEYGAQNFGIIFVDGLRMWYPGDADAGMIARQQFYTAVRYDGSDGATEDLELVAGNPPITSNGTIQGDLNRLLEWHYEAVPDDFELRRNDVIYDSYQFNRNPFIDRPEYVWSVFVDQQNDSQIAISGGSTNGNGGSTAQVDLGRVLVGAPVPASQTVSLNKSGSDGTYYSVATSGLATSTVTGRYNAFSTGGADSSNLDVGLNTNTNSAGGRSGSVTIDNLDVTTAGGAGRGANDANDVVDITLDVLDHANPSFAGGSDVNTLTHDFGSITMGSAMPTFDFDLFNLEGTAGFTAGLDLDSIVGAGDTSMITTDLELFSGVTSLEAGTSSGFTASLDSSTAGIFSASYTLSFSDEDLPGASSLGSLVLTLMGTVEEASVETADFDEDDDVDGEDFLAWQRGFLVGATLAEGDANRDTSVNELDLAVWQRQYGSEPPASGLLRAVPEPSAVAMWWCGLATFLGIARRPGGRLKCSPIANSCIVFSNK